MLIFVEMLLSEVKFYKNVQVNKQFYLNNILFKN